MSGGYHFFGNRMKRTLLHIALVLLCLCGPAGPMLAQNHVRKAMQRAREQQEALARKDIDSQQGGPSAGGYLTFLVENGDTTYFDSIEPTWVFGRRKGGKGNKEERKDWRKYYKLVYNFAKVYPYAKAARRLDQIADSTITANGYNRAQKEKYVNGIQKRLFADFEGALHKMTITQGALLLKLIDRETDKTSYSIIKEYKSGIAAGFWEGVAKVFDNSLKSEYDAEGADRDIEELVKKWEDGSFPAFYYSIFWETPPEVPVPDFYK